MTAALVALVWALVSFVVVLLACLLAGLLWAARLVHRTGLTALAARLGQRP